MIIVAVEPEQRIWSVADLLLPEQVAHIQAIDWLSMPWRRGYLQETWRRRWIDKQHLTIVELNQYIIDRLPAINQALSTNYGFINVEWWIDEPGFRVGIHTDGELPNSMQITWRDIGSKYGTGFCQDKRGEQVIWAAPGQANTGYIMLNHKREDGSQPLLWHGMTTPVPEGCYRLSCYCTFYA